MQDVSLSNSEVAVEKKTNNKIAVVSILIVCGLILLYFLITTGFAPKKHTLTSYQPSQINQQTPSTNTQQAQAVQPLPHINTVTLTKNGFSPEKTIIQKGTAVKWINNTSTDNASVNSDDYPSNTRFPELNLGKFNSGSALAHIFTTVGTYTYHNEFNPKQKGTIIVQ